jgi:hypothetical protein
VLLPVCHGAVARLQRWRSIRAWLPVSEAIVLHRLSGSMIGTSHHHSPAHTHCLPHCLPIVSLTVSLPQSLPASCTPPCTSRAPSPSSPPSPRPRARGCPGAAAATGACSPRCRGYVHRRIVLAPEHIR